MNEVHFAFDEVPAFALALREAAPKHLLRSMGKAFFRIGKSDIEKLKTEQLNGVALKIKSKGFLNSFKFKATDSRQAQSIDQLTLSEYTGAKPFSIFQTGGDISPSHSRMLTILTDAARTAGGKRKYSQKELSAMIASGQAKIIQTRAGAAIVLNQEKFSKSGALRKGSKMTILAWLRPRVHEQKRIDFFGNYDANSAEHERILGDAAAEAIERTIGGA